MTCSRHPGTTSEIHVRSVNAAVDTKLLVDLAVVAVHGVPADAEAMGNLLVRAATGNVVEDFALAVGQEGQSAGFGRKRLEVLRDFAGDGRTHGRAAGVDALYRLDELGERRLLEQVAARAGFEALEYFLMIIMHGEHEDLQGGPAAFEFASAVDAAGTGQAQVHEHDVTFAGWQIFQRVFGGGVGGNTAEAGRAIEQHGEARARLVVVFDDGNADEGHVVARILNGKSGKME